MQAALFEPVGVVFGLHRQPTPLVVVTHELVDAIESESSDEICEELGDVLFQILFIAELYRETGDFSMDDVMDRINEKMVSRHPHVFGDSTVTGVEDVKKKWQKIKMTEKNHVKNESVLDSVPVSLPALMRSYGISERAVLAGFDWKDRAEVVDKVEEEWSELKVSVIKCV